jgi:hypothetical protein
MTVRFEEPPLPGIRMYFCQHLTPEYVWRSDLMQHANGMQRLVQINAYSPESSVTAACIAAIADVPMMQDGSAAEVLLANLHLRIEADPALSMARLHGATMVARDNSSFAVDLTAAALSG